MYKAGKGKDADKQATFKVAITSAASLSNAYVTIVKVERQWCTEGGGPLGAISFYK